MGWGWAGGALDQVNHIFRGIHDNYDPAIHWMHDSWHQIGGNKIPDQPGLHSIASGVEKKPANYAAGILGALYGGAVAMGSSAGGAGAGAGADAGIGAGAAGGTDAAIGGSAGASSAVPIEEAGFAAGSTPSGAGWTTGTGGTGASGGLSSVSNYMRGGNMLSKLMQGGSGGQSSASGSSGSNSIQVPQDTGSPAPQLTPMDELVQKALLYTGESDMNYSHGDMTALLGKILSEKQPTAGGEQPTESADSAASLSDYV